ncbi:lipopolysaccharide biosynthesis protein [Blastococcus montanus]|uniref:lipopolysaccharide biosynthesis protein n=1 Tax=Blastococcus montanus TaxID=3144973 RepID=UPI003209F842
MSTDIASPSPEPGGSLRQRATQGVLWTALEKWSVRVSTLIGFILLGRLLEPQEFGVVALAMTFITILAIVSDAGFTTYLVQLQRLTSTIASTAFYISVALGAVLAVLLAALSGPVSALLDTPRLQPILAALAISLFITGLASVPAALMQKEMRFRELALRQVVATVLSVAVAIALAFAGAGAWALVAQTLVRVTISTIVLWATAGFRPQWTFSIPEMRVMSAFGAKSLGAQLANAMRGQSEVFIIGALAGTTALGLWTVAQRLVQVIVEVCTSVFSTVAHPVFARLQTDPPRLSRALGTAQASGALVLVPVLACLSLTSGQVVPAVFGQQWEPAAVLASIMAVRSLVVAMSTFSRSAFLATGHPGTELLVTLVLLAGQLGLVLAFADDLLLLAVVLTAWSAFALPLRAVLLHRLLKISARTYEAPARVLLAGGVATAAVLGVQQLAELDGWGYVAFVALLGGTVYLAVVFLIARSVVLDLGQSLRGAVGRRGAAKS